MLLVCYTVFLPCMQCSVVDLKYLIEAEMGIPAYEQRLSFNHTTLEDVYTDPGQKCQQRLLGDYPGIQQGSTIHLVRLTGLNLLITCNRYGRADIDVKFFLNISEDPQVQVTVLSSLSTLCTENYGVLLYYRK